jgi:hypothetical protein
MASHAAWRSGVHHRIGFRNSCGRDAEQGRGQVRGADVVERRRHRRAGQAEDEASERPAHEHADGPRVPQPNALMDFRGYPLTHRTEIAISSI